MFSGVKPAEVLAALVALAEGPRVAWEPGILKGRQSGLRATDCPRKGDNPERDPIRVGKRKMVFPLIFETVVIDGDAVQAPRTKPVTVGVRDGDGGPRVERWLANRRHYQLCFACGFAADELNRAGQHGQMSSWSHTVI